MSKQTSSSKQSRRHGSRMTASEVLEGIDLSGKTVLITGTTSGIGMETARVLALTGAHIVMANRNIPASEKLKQEICDEAKGFVPKIDILQLDLSSLESVRQAADEFSLKRWPLHILLLNAGLTSWNGELSVDGYERTFAVNHLGHFYLSILLMKKLRESAPSRLVVVSSLLHAQTGIRPNKSLNKKLQKLLTTPS
ncbi:short chain dehydrogenase domain-containing protein [Ditylenchus destructor]|uniref:Short chain dehydrogenase domain-containing protein n=1 Tax=Ditylenchus destructor TaxID=166010 RepID=A0AAD4MKL3_9BILA|nr:short chain dehydrogenase domain-containing protein [Ditylenchus destructor]